MNRRRTLLLLVAILVLGAGLVILFRVPSSRPLLHLRITHRAVIGGQPVVFFRVQVSSNKRIQICNVLTVEEPDGHISHALLAGKPWISATFPENFPIDSPSQCRKEFGVLALSNAPIWKLRLTVNVENAGLGKRLKSMPGMWRVMRRKRWSITEATWGLWNSFGTHDSYVIESDPITNSVPLVIAK